MALCLLWRAARPPDPVQPLRAELDAMLTAEPRLVHITDGRVMIRGADGRRFEIFADEVAPEQWAALRRQYLGV